MSFEKSPTTLPEQEGQSSSTPEGVKNQKRAAEQEIKKKIISNLSPENKNFLGKMSEEGVKIASQVYEGLYNTPGVNRIVGKLEIAYNQFWIDKYQQKAAKFKGKMDGLDLRIGALDESKKEIESFIKSLKSQNIPGAESLQIKLQNIDRQKVELLNEKDKKQSKFEAIDNKLKLYTNERDRVADKLIGYYEEKLKPMEAELERLQTFNNQIDLLAAAAEVKNKEFLNKLDDLKKRKDQIAETLHKTGMSEKKIRKSEAIKALKQIENILLDGQKKVRMEKENLAKRKAEINKRIAKVDSKANPYRDKREEFIRIKKGRPIEIKVAPRQRSVDVKGGEEIRVHSIKVEVGIREVGNEERLRIADYLSLWNTFLKEIYKDKAEVIDTKDFLRETGLPKNSKLDFEDFKNILEKYLKYRKLPVDQFNQNIKKFFEQKIKTE